MKDFEKIICLVKFGKHEHLLRLLEKGEIFFNHPQQYNKWSKKEEQSGDKNEGAEWIENARVAKIEYDHPELGKGEFIPVPNQLSKLTQYNYYYLSHSIYAMTKDKFEKQNTFNIDARNAELKDADSAIIIQKPYEFMNSVISEMKTRNLKYEANLVDYKDLSNAGRFELNPFIKKIEHKHQSEFRIIIENLDDKAKTIHIGSIKEYSQLVSSKSMIETIWTAKR